MFITTCPSCGIEDHLTIISGVFVARGMQLCSDGFAFDEAKELNTEEESVQCSSCQHMFDLDNLYREDLPEPPGKMIRVKESD